MKSILQIVYDVITTAGYQIATDVSGRVWANIMPSGFANTQKSIVYHVSSAAAEISDATFEATVVCKCYGGSNNPLDAESVFRNLYDRLVKNRGEAVSSGVILKFWLESLSASVDPDEGWPVVIAIFRLRAEN